MNWIIKNLKSYYFSGEPTSADAMCYRLFHKGQKTRRGKLVLDSFTYLNSPETIYSVSADDKTPEVLKSFIQ